METIEVGTLWRKHVVDVLMVTFVITVSRNWEAWGKMKFAFQLGTKKEKCS